MDTYDITIVGGSGFLGSKLAKHLSNKFRVKVIDLKPIPDDLKGDVDFQKIDIRNCESVQEAIRNAELVIHTAIIGIPRINEEKRLGYEVNVIGAQNVCEAVIKNDAAKGLILTGTWHIFGEWGLNGTISEEFGCRPDKVEERARYYALTKTVQENVVRIYDEAYEKIFGIVRCGTILGEGMSEKTAANTFISNALEGKPITPYRHSLYRPMLYVDSGDVCKAFEIYAKKILNNEIEDRRKSLAHIVNFAWSKPITILELAEIVRDAVTRCSCGETVPAIEIVDKGLPDIYQGSVNKPVTLSLGRASKLLEIKSLTDPKGSIESLVKSRMLRSKD